MAHRKECVGLAVEPNKQDYATSMPIFVLVRRSAAPVRGVGQIHRVETLSIVGIVVPYEVF